MVLKSVALLLVAICSVTALQPLVLNKKFNDNFTLTLNKSVEYIILFENETVSIVDCFVKNHLVVFD